MKRLLALLLTIAVMIAGAVPAAQDSSVECYGKIAVSKGGGAENHLGRIFVREGGSLNIKGNVNISEYGAVVNSGTMNKYKSAKITGEIVTPTNICEDLAEELSALSDVEKVSVNFMFYDSDTMKNTKIDGMNYLDIYLKLQNDYYIPRYISLNCFNSSRNFTGNSGGYKELKALLDTTTSPALAENKLRQCQGLQKISPKRVFRQCDAKR
jgi:hypothetical protein